MLSTKNILLVVVNYNQSLEIRSFLLSLMGYWPVSQTIVIDDGSTDGSVEIVEELGIPFLRHDQNCGVGAAIRTGILHAKTNHYKSVLIMSSNGKMLPSEIPRVIGPLLTDQADYVTGSRFLVDGGSPGLSLFRRNSIPVFSFFSSILLRKRFTDITCGFRCYRIDFLFDGKCNIHQDWLSGYEMEYYIHYWACQSALRIAEVPVTIRYSHLPKKRHSKIRPILDWWAMARPLIYLRLKLRK